MPARERLLFSPLNTRVDGALARAGPGLHRFQNVRCLDAELLELRTASDNGLDFGKDESSLLCTACRGIDLASGSASGPNMWQQTRPAMSPVFPFPLATLEIASRTSTPRIDALDELALVRQQPHFLTAQNSLGNRKEFKKRGPLSPQGEAGLLALFFDIPHRIP